MVRRLVQNVLLKRRGLLLGLIALTTVTCSAMPADAALLDWLFPGRAARRAARRQYYYVVPGSPAVNANYSPYHTTNYGSSGPSTTPHAWYAPQTQYRSLWTQVPVTTYRPVGTNGLQPCTSYAWQTQRVPVTSYQPVLAAAAAPAASACSCDSGATTAYYGSTPAYSPWQTVAPSTGNLYGYRSASEFAPTVSATTGQVVTAGYAQDFATGTTTVDYAGATPWTPVEDTYDPTGGASPWQSYDGSYDDAQRSSETQNGATPWQPVDSNAEPTPADQSPTLNRPDYDAGRSRSELNDAGRSRSERDGSEIDRDSTRPDSQRPEVDDRWRYDEMHDPDSGSSTTRTGHSRQDLRPLNEQFVPFQRPIPDPDRDYNWDFDDKFQRRQARPARSARRSDSRWEAIPVSASFSPQPHRDEHVRTSDRVNRPVDDLLPPAPPRRPLNQGGWRSLAR